MAEQDETKAPEETPEQTDETTELEPTEGDKLAPVDHSGAPQEGGITEHQDGAPEEAVKVVEEAEEKGYLGVGTDKPDYSQANSAVMNGGA